MTEGSSSYSEGHLDVNTFANRNEYRIVPQTGTGDLVGITGAWTQSPDSPDVHGWVRCKVRSADS